MNVSSYPCHTLLPWPTLFHVPSHGAPTSALHFHVSGAQWHSTFSHRRRRRIHPCNLQKLLILQPTKKCFILTTPFPCTHTYNYKEYHVGFWHTLYSLRDIMRMQLIKRYSTIFSIQELIPTDSCTRSWKSMLLECCQPYSRTKEEWGKACWISMTEVSLLP